MAHDHDHAEHGAHDHAHDHGAPHHGHDHGHDHGPLHLHHHAGGTRSALQFALILNGGFLLIEAAVGFWTGSLALLGDATHMVSDVAALSLAVVASHLTSRPATRHGTFGLLRAEILGAFLNAVALVVACVFIFKEAAERLIAGPPPVAGMPILVVAVIGLIINLGSAARLMKADGNKDLNVRGALLHMLVDALGSLGALIAGLLTMFFQLYAADAIASVVIGVLVLFSGWGLLRDSTRVLLEFAPAGLEQDVVLAKLAAISGVRAVHELHVWSLGSGFPVVTAHLVPAEGSSADDVLRRAEAVLKDELGVAHTTIQIDPVGGAPCRQEECPMFAAGARPKAG